MPLCQHMPILDINTRDISIVVYKEKKGRILQNCKQFHMSYLLITKHDVNSNITCNTLLHYRLH